MEEKRKTKVSKFLSYVLRHRPDEIGIELDDNGWTDIKTLMQKSKYHKRSFTHDELLEVVRTNNKKRFAISEDGRRIRANQGHSVEVDLQYEPATPPEVLYHGTGTKLLDAIYKTGLQKMNRHHVHLSADKATATNVGQRRGNCFILAVDTQAMVEEEYTFFVTPNGVWLTDHVPPKFLSHAE
jgi:putative RNA 2'-phosphotransferase